MFSFYLIHAGSSWLLPVHVDLAEVIRKRAMGIEPTPQPSNNKHLQQTIDEKARKSVDLMSESGEIPPELATVIRAWPHLPKHIRAAIMALVQAGQR